ncbi:hypothetical protein WJ542_31605 [Paraburkholderia sp. B3]|uniref:hypothetical protein n=1 Tax=Paraburkholderia sp. B3 TaxID=3134791 RepID=UPI0039829642
MGDIGILDAGIEETGPNAGLSLDHRVTGPVHTPPLPGNDDQAFLMKSVGRVTGNVLCATRRGWANPVAWLNASNAAAADAAPGATVATMHKAAKAIVRGIVLRLIVRE